MKRYDSLRTKLVLSLVLLLVLVLLAPAVHASGQIHIVRPGENLYRIALRYGTTVTAIASANGIRNPRLIYVGQRLIIPGWGTGGAPGGGTGGAPGGGTGGGTGGTPGGGTGGGTGGAPGGGTGGGTGGAPGGGTGGAPGGGTGGAPGGGTGGGTGGGPSGWCQCSYVVRRGDTLSAIAWRHGTSVWNLVRMNGLANPNLIWPGQRLCVPCGGYHPPTPPAPRPPTCGVVHVVQRGDTVYSIARRYGSTVQAIARANHLWNPSLIWVGQRLYIPCR